MRVEDLINALDYIELNLRDRLSVQDIADHCYSSVSGLEKTFKYVFRMPINEYILRRKYSCAAKDLLTTGDTILEISLNYGYKNAESFTRGFRKIWHVSPSEFRRTRKFSGHTPQLSLNSNCLSEEDMKTGYDLTELYDVLQERKNCAYVCADMCGLMWINDNLGMAAGDAALLEMIERVEAACGEEDILLRIGGDEFVVLTGSPDMTHAAQIVSEVAARNGEPVKYGDLEFPLTIHIGAFIRNHDPQVAAEEMFREISEGIRKIHNA